MKYFVLCPVFFLVFLLPELNAQDLYYNDLPESVVSREIFECCLAVKFDTAFHVDPYEFAQSFDFLKYDPRLEENYVGFYIFHVRPGQGIYGLMDVLRQEASVLMVNPVWRGDECYPGYLVDELIVRFNDGVSVEQRDSILSEFGLEITATGYLYIVIKVRGKTNKDIWEIGNDLMATGFLMWTQPNCVFHPLTDEMKGDLNYDFEIDIEDLVWLVNNVFNHGLGPIGWNLTADLNCDLVLGMADIIRYVNYLYRGQPLLPD